MIDNVVGTLVFAIAANVGRKQTSKLRLHLAATATGVIGSPLVFASNCFGLASRDGMFDAHEPAACVDRERV